MSDLASREPESRRLPRRLRRLLVVAATAGFLATSWLLATAGSGAAASLERLANPSVVGFLLAATSGNVALRFVRWQYFLRRAGLRTSTRHSLRIFLGALGLGFVPLFAGEIAYKGAALSGGDRSTGALASTIAVYERLCDLVILSSFAALYPLATSAPDGIGWIVFLVPPLVFAIPPARHASIRAGRVATGLIARLLGGGVPQGSDLLPERLALWRHTAVGLLLGAAAWLCVCLAAAAVGHVLLDEGAWAVAPLFARVSVLGGASLSPGGVAVTGMLLNRELVELGLDAGGAFALTLAIRVFTFWLVLGVGQIALIRNLLARETEVSHFDGLSPEYDAQIPHHIRDLLVSRKTGRMLELLPNSAGTRALDIGCGLGWYMQKLRGVGCDVVGMDLSAVQARAAAESGALVIRGSATRLAFASGTFDFAYTVNVIHHLPSRKAQAMALREVTRVLKPGGYFFLHEINVTNPIFRFYMGYVFPLIKRIDEGTELWLDPEDLPLPEDIERIRVSYFTFLPDFLPRGLVALALPIEQRLERSRWARYSAHFMVALRKKGGPSSQASAVEPGLSP